jgi:hypothetical protein
MSLSPIPTDPKLTDTQGAVTPAYQAWFSAIQRWLAPNGQFGTTAMRPTAGLYVGQFYYDTTLGYPVWVHQVSPSIVWHNGAGGVV